MGDEPDPEHPEPAPPRVLHAAGLIVAVAVAYHVVAQASLRLAIPPGFASPVWPAAAIGLVATLRYGYRVAPGVFLGSFSINVLISGGLDAGLSARALLTASSIGVGATLQAALGAHLVRRVLGPSPPLADGAPIGWFFVLGGAIACLVNSLVGAATLVGAGAIAPSAFVFTWWTWWTGDFIGVMTVAPVLLSLVGVPRDTWRSRRRSVAIPLCSSLAVLVTVFVIIRASETDRQRHEFAVQARTLALTIQRDIDAHLGVIGSVAHLCAHVEDVTPAEFERFAGALLPRAPRLHALQWSAPRTGEGTVEYLVPTLERVDHPPGSTMHALMGQARDAGSAVSPVEHAAPSDPRGAMTVGMALAVYEDGVVPAPSAEHRPLGYVLGTFGISEIVDASLQRSPLRHVRLRVGDPSTDLWLHRAIEQGPVRDDGAPIEGEPAASPLDWSGSLSVADHPWFIEITPTATYFATDRPWSVWMVAVGGMFMTGLLGAFLLFLTGQAQRTRREVEARTQQLARANSTLQQEITEHEQTELALRKAKDQAESATRAKSQFLARMSHEIRTPMNAIMGMTELLLDTELSDQQRESLQAVSHAGGVLGRLIDDILDLSKVEVGKIELRPRAFSLHLLLRHLEQLLCTRMEQAGLTLRVEIGPEVPSSLHGDPDRLMQVFTNLLGNAMKFTDPGGEVDVRVTRSPRGSDDPEAPVSLRCSVADTGRGIAKQDQQRIFESFEQADNSFNRRHGGTGLGLTITAHLVELMGGRLRVSSELGRGSTFEFSVVLHQAPGGHATTPSQPATAEPPAGLRRPLRILLAEDNVVNQKVARAMLHKAGHTVVVVGDGRQAVERREADDGFDAILMDVEMPVMDGLEAFEAIRAHERAAGLRPVPIIALTAHAIQDETTETIRATMDGYLTKPIGRERLCAVLDEVLDRTARGR